MASAIPGLEQSWVRELAAGLMLYIPAVPARDVGLSESHGETMTALSYGIVR